MKSKLDLYLHEITCCLDGYDPQHAPHVIAAIASLSSEECGLTLDFAIIEARWDMEQVKGALN